MNGRLQNLVAKGPTYVIGEMAKLNNSKAKEISKHNTISFYYFK